MDVRQIWEITNTATSETLGETAVVNEDLSNIVDIGERIFNSNALDRYVKSLVNHIGKIIFVQRTYKPNLPDIYRDSWEYGSVVEKIQMDIPDAEENESWSLNDRASYDQQIFYQPKISAKFFNKKITFEIPISLTEKQVRQSFSNAQQLNTFMSMVYNAVEKAMNVRLDNLKLRTIANFIGETIHAEYPEGNYSESSGVRAVNILKLYTTEKGVALDADKALTDADFLRYASYTMATYLDRLRYLSVLFNLEGKQRQTPRELLHVIMLSDFKRGADMYLESDTFHNELVSLPLADTVPYWQGSGVDYSFNSKTGVNIRTASGDDVNITGIVGVMFDHDALGIFQEDRRVTSAYNAKAEFFNNWHKFDANYFNDFSENFIVFFVA